MELSDFDVDRSCRACLLPSHQLEPLFETLFDDSPLSEILSSVVSSIEVEKDDVRFPHKICASCQASAVNAYKFQQMCVANDKKIRQLIESQTKFDLDGAIKTEEPGSEVLQDDLAEVSLDITLQSDSNDVMLTDLKPLDDDSDSDSPNDSQDDSDSMSSDASEDDDGKCKKYDCDSCDKSFTSSSKLEHHLRNAHHLLKKSKSAGSEENESSDDDDDDSAKIFTCDACPKKFKKPSLLARHIKTHDPNKRPHECPKCQKRFPSQVALVRHDILHSDLVERSKIDRPEPQEFSCVVCGRSFKSPESLSSHLKTHKSKSIEDQEYTCKLCHDAFPTFSDIQRHSKNHIENATHQCAICNKLFVVGDELIDHFLRHKGMKPHSCPICEKSFLKLHKLNVHMRTHSDDKVRWAGGSLK